MARMTSGRAQRTQQETQKAITASPLEVAEVEEGLGGTNAKTADTFTNPLAELDKAVNQFEKDTEAAIFNTVAGSKVVDPTKPASADAQIEGKLVNAITGGSAGSMGEAENLLINAVFGAFLG